MSTTDTFLAVFLGSKTSAKMAAWIALPEAERRTKEQQGMAAWKAWVEKHQAAIVAMGGPLGKTKRVDASGIADIANEMGAFTVVRAPSHEAAAKLFENHPHFAIFPGERVEIMPVLPIPGGNGLRRPARGMAPSPSASRYAAGSDAVRRAQRRRVSVGAGADHRRKAEDAGPRRTGHADLGRCVPAFQYRARRLAGRAHLRARPVCRNDPAARWELRVSSRSARKSRQRRTP